MTQLPPGIKIALVHEWLVVPAGSEQVLQEMIAVFPEADVFCLVDHLSPADRTRLGVGRPRTSFLQKMPAVHRYYRALLPLMPAAVEALDVSAYDIVISNSHAVAKGARAAAGALHVCHCCSPMRYAWDLREQYLREAHLDTGVGGWFANRMLNRMRAWDARSSAGVDEFIAISTFIAERIQRAYGRSSTVLYPPVDTEFYTPDGGERGNAYVTASRLVPYKRMAAIVQAFRLLPHCTLTVIGDGPERQRVAAAAGSNVTLMGWQPREVLREQFRRARAFIFAAEEDFGILPVEAQACGAPVLALGRGGALETVIASGPLRTGSHFADATPECIASAVRTFEANDAPSPAACRANAERFGVRRFREEFMAKIVHAWSEHLQAAHSLPARLRSRTPA